MTTRLALAATGLAALVIAAPAHAAVSVNGACTTDLTLSAGSTQLACVGRYDKNALSNNDNATINQALTALGYTGPAISYSGIASGNILSGLNGGTIVNFPGLLNGTVYLGVHYGNGQGGPGNSTTFYKLSASNLDKITLNLNASSTATLFASTQSPVPEPATWAMMVFGFTGLGYAMRRRQPASPRIRFA